jgi:hypothetical protein
MYDYIYTCVECVDLNGKARIVSYITKDDGFNVIVDIIEFHADSLSFYEAVESIKVRIKFTDMFVTESFGSDVVDSGELSNAELLEIYFLNKEAKRLCN